MIKYAVRPYTYGDIIIFTIISEYCHCSAIESSISYNVRLRKSSIYFISDDSIGILYFYLFYFFNAFLFFKVDTGSRYLQYNTNTIKRGPKGVHKLILIIVLPQHRGPDIVFTTFVCGYFRNYVIL